MRFAAVACCLALAACAKPTPPVDVPPVADPCPSEGLAPIKAEPAHPVPDPMELGAVFGAIAGVIGPDRAQALVRFWETERPQWGGQGWARVKAVKSWCDERNKPPPDT